MHSSPRRWVRRRGRSDRPAASNASADHSPDLLADNHVAEANLAHLPIHVIDEQFGKLDTGERLIGILVDAMQNECEHEADHVKAPVKRVGHAACAVPMRHAGGGNDGIPERTARLARIGFGPEQPAEQGKHAATLRRIPSAGKVPSVSLAQAFGRHKPLVRSVRLRLRGARTSARFPARENGAAEIC